MFSIPSFNENLLNTQVDKAPPDHSKEFALVQKFVDFFIAILKTQKYVVDKIVHNLLNPHIHMVAGLSVGRS